MRKRSNEEIRTLSGLGFSCCINPKYQRREKSQRDRLEEKANKLEKKIDVLMVLCKQVDFAGAWAYCFSKGYDIYKDRLYKYVDPSYQIVLENKMYSWSQKLKSS